ncbi:MAG: hypothetical protein U0269_12295 [Polyangiales bacterium]
MSKRRWFSWTMVTCAFAMVTAFHCGPMGTGGARTRIQASVRGATPTSATSLGWSITYEQALISVDTMRWSAGEPVFDARLRQRFLRSISIGTAFAHPGHYTPGEALADVSVARLIDLLGPTIQLDAITAVTGTSNSASISLRPADAARAAGTRLSAGSSVRAQGTATKDGASVRFRLEISDAIDIEGAPAHGEIRADGSTSFELSVDLGLWLDRADFATLAMSAPAMDGVIDVPADGQVRNAFVRGVNNGAAYRITLLPSSR